MVTDPAMDALAMSVPVMVWDPDRSNVAENVPCPPVSVESGGRATPVDVSVVVKWTVPAYDRSVLPFFSSDPAATEKAFPAVVVEAGLVASARCVVGAATTVIVIGLDPEPTLSEAVIVCAPAFIKVAVKVP